MNDKQTYEAMFLLDAGNPDFNAASEPVRNILTRYEAEILSFKAWDERRLAYEILGRKRGLYVLSYFKLDPLRVHEVEHDCRLDERVLRALILRRERLTQEQIDAETPATTQHRAAAAAESAATESAAAPGAPDAPASEPVEQAEVVEEEIEDVIEAPPASEENLA